jgi:hypothetical protein
MANPMARIQRATHIKNDLVYEVRTNAFSLEPVNHWLLEVRTRTGSVVATAKDLSSEGAYLFIRDWAPDVEIIYFN